MQEINIKEAAAILKEFLDSHSPEELRAELDKRPELQKLDNHFLYPIKSEILDSDCNNPQCQQVHNLLDSLLEYFDAQFDKDAASISKSLILMEQIKNLESLNKQLLKERDQAIKDFKEMTDNYLAHAEI